jgi:hypothetical protein
MLLGFVTMQTVSASKATAAASDLATIGMPFDGKWAWNVPASGNWYDNVNDSHPATHENYAADWATDLYAAPGTNVRVWVLYATSAYTLKITSVSDTSCGAGKRVRVGVFFGGQERGWVQYDHLNTAVTMGSNVSNGASLGTTSNWGLKSCYQVSSDSGVHVHASMKNSGSGYSCWADRGQPGGAVLASKSDLGMIGSPNNGIKQSCQGGFPTHGSPTPPVSQADNIASSPAVTFNDQLHVFGRGINNEIYDNVWNGGSWSGFQRIAPGATFKGKPTAIVYGSVLALYARGTDNQMHNNVWNGTSWTGFTTVNPGATFDSDPVAIKFGNSLNLLARGVDGHIYDNVWNGGSWSGFTNTDPNATFVGELTAAQFGTAFGVFARGSNGELYDNTWDGASWSGFVRFAPGATFSGNPKAVSFGGALHVFARGTDNALHRNVWTNSWSGFQNVQPGTYFKGDPALMQFGVALGVFARGLDDQVYNNTFGTAGWDGFQIIGSGSVFNGDPFAAVYGNAMAVFGRGINAEIYDNTWDGASWSGFVRFAPNSVFESP